MKDSFYICTQGYGLCIFSLSVLLQCCKDYAVKSRNLLAFFDKHNDFFYYCLSKGALIPIHHLDFEELLISFNIGRVDNDKISQYGKLKSSWKGFNLAVLSNEIWVVQLDYLRKWTPSIFKNKERIEGSYYDINDVEHSENKAVKLFIPSGNYNVNIYGIEESRDRKHSLIFELFSATELLSNVDVSEINFRNIYDE